MRNLVCKTWAILLVALFAYQPSFADFNSNPSTEKITAKKEFTRSIKKEFSISSDGNVGISNKYGKVDINTWGQNQVKIEVTITVNTSSESRAEAVFDRIGIDFSNGNDYVNAETNIESSKKGWMSSWWDNGNNGDFKIDYEVYMPATCDLEVSNKYGHSTIAALKGDAKVTAKYGDVHMETISGDLDLDVGYGNANIQSAGNTNIDIKYGKVNLESAGNVNLESKYSKVYLSNAGDVETISKYDTYRLGKIGSLNNQGKYDDFEIEWAKSIAASCRYSDYDVRQLNQGGKFNMSYGGLRVETLDQGFSKLEVDASYTDIKVGVADGAAYKIDVATSYAGVNYPKGADIRYDVQQNNKHELRGDVGGGGNSEIRVRSSYGHVKVW